VGILFTSILNFASKNERTLGKRNTNFGYPAFLILPLQQWEQYHIADGRRAGEHHDEAVDAAGWGYAVFEGFDEVVVHLRDHPSVLIWSPFNESWGQHDSMELGKMAAE
jgi:beta-galactosidase/beta-glucuronidase